MSNKIKLKKISYTSCYQLAVLHKQAWLDTYCDVFPFQALYGVSIQKKKRQFKRAMNDNKTSFHFICSEQDIVGFLVFREHKNQEIMDLLAIYILKDYWKHGYGSQTMDLVKHHCFINGLKRINLWVLNSNRSALRFYFKHSFTQGNETKKQYLYGKQVELMKLEFHSDER